MVRTVQRALTTLIILFPLSNNWLVSDFCSTSIIFLPNEPRTKEKKTQQLLKLLVSSLDQDPGFYLCHVQIRRHGFDGNSPSPAEDFSVLIGYRKANVCSGLI